MHQPRQKAPAKANHSRSFIFIDQKTHLLPRDELSSIRRHISNEASQKRRRIQSGRELPGSTEKPEKWNKSQSSNNDPKDDKSKPNEAVDLVLAEFLDYQIQRASIDASPKLDTYLAGGRIDSLGILALASEQRRELELMYVIFKVTCLLSPVEFASLDSKLYFKERSFG